MSHLPHLGLQGRVPRRSRARAMEQVAADVAADTTNVWQSGPSGAEMTAPDCVFCQIVVGAAPAKVVREWPLAIAIVPLNPVTPGHLLVLPREHVRDAADSPAVTGYVAVRAAELAAARHTQFNLITSTGPAATQTVWHLHWHIVPRRFDDGLTLPWTGQQTGGTQ